MKPYNLRSFIIVLILFFGLGSSVFGQFWPQFRGPEATGILDGANLPVSWNLEAGQNVLWETPIPGLGHSCPVIWEDKIFVTTAISASGNDGLKVGLYGDIDEDPDESVHQFRVYCLNKHVFINNAHGRYSPIYVVKPTAEEIKCLKLSKVALLGTRFNMEQDFYKGRLRDKHGIRVITPDGTDMDLIHKIAYNELCLGDIRQTSRDVYLEIIDKLIEQGAQGIVLGCTEIPLLVKQKDVSVPILDTTLLHAQAAVEFAIGHWSLHFIITSVLAPTCHPGLDPGLLGAAPIYMLPLPGNYKKIVSPPYSLRGLLQTVLLHFGQAPGQARGDKEVKQHYS